MFEKQAEEYLQEKLEERKDKFVFELPKVYIEDVKQSFRDGAEFGYNKANEWHYPSKGEYPTENTMLLLARKTVNGIQALIGYYRREQFEVFNEKSCNMKNIDNVYAWKEIVLPERLKESE